jgi:hypothetical protein
MRLLRARRRFLGIRTVQYRLTYPWKKVEDYLKVLDTFTGTRT